MAFDSVGFATLIRDELAKLPNVKLGTTQSFVSCPFHDERTPSGRIRHDPDKPGIGNFKCYGCRKTAKWNEVAAVLGLQQFGKDAAETDKVPHTNFQARDERLLSIRNAPSHRQVVLQRFSLLSPSAEYAGINNGWRGYSMKFLQRVGAELAFDPVREKYYILLRVLVRGREMGYIQAELEKPTDKRFPSYWNKKGEWSKTHGLFPYDYTIGLMNKLGLSTIVLVEGPRDALRLLRMNIPALCILGTHSWEARKRKLLEFADVRRIITMFDGDEAGFKCHQLIRADTRESFEYRAVKLWKYPVPKDHPEDKLDPGNCPAHMIDQLRGYLV